MALFDMVRSAGAYVEAAHVNYHKRGTADRDEKIVKDYCLKYEIPFHLHDFDAEDHSGNFQAAARKERYDFFREVCEKQKLDLVLVAHQMDDLIETYLMQKQRKLGVSYYGLKKENDLYGVKVLRPLLGFTKQELITYCEDNGVPYGIDESNLEDAYTRNKIRHQVADKLTYDQKKELVTRIEEENRIKGSHYEKTASLIGKETFSVPAFQRIPYLYDYLCFHFPSLSKAHYKEMRRQLIEADKAVFEGEDLILCKEYGKIAVFPKPAAYSYVFDSLQDMYGFSCERFSIGKAGNKIEGVCLKKEDFPLCIRNARKDDIIKMRFGKKKLNRFFIDRKISYKEELGWPLMVNKDGTVIFVAGLGCDVNHYCEDPDVFMIKC
ncbi:MAG: tRNA lysidine(34) synthetase TilS [Erysipelotrichaceae bacterium]|nr:tRNA lysidine(34) synthetase TilS [Erysipelotrichaceae bacterium]